MSQTDNAALLPITRVTLYTSGVGYFERAGQIAGEAAVTLFFPVGQVNDVLKSLVLLDGGDGATLQPVTYATQDPVRRALQAFSVDVSDNPDRSTLLNRLRGTGVTLTTDDPHPLAGTILGVETQTVTLGNDSTVEQHTLNLLADDGLHAVPLASVRRLQFTDAALGEELRQALAAVAQGRDANKRPVTLKFAPPEGKVTQRRVQVGYLAEAPAWQTTYRLVLGDQPLLQGWALVQNTGQDDWADARLSLVSGRPISFIQDLYTPLYVHRPTVQPRIPASPTPQTYASDMMPPAAEAEMDYMMAAPAAAPPPAPAMRARKAMAAMSREEGAFVGGLSLGDAAGQSVATSGAQLGASLFAYHIDVPVSVARQQSAMIPFVSAPIEAERVSVYNAQVQSDHPLSGARLRNTTDLHLMGGPLTVFDSAQPAQEAGYVGDALMDNTEPGQSRLLTYAIDLAVDAETKSDGTGTAVVSVAIAQGTLKVSQRITQKTTYTFKNHGAQPRTVLVEHPHREPQWTLAEPAAPAERTADVYRFSVPVAPGRTAALAVRQERPAVETLALLGTDMGHLLHFARLGETSERVRAALEDLAARRAKTAELEAKLADIDAQLAAIAKGQERIRQNMQTLDHKSDLYRRYVGELDSQETKIASLQTERQTLATRLSQAQADLNKYVAQLKLE